MVIIAAKEILFGDLLKLPAILKTVVSGPATRNLDLSNAILFAITPHSFIHAAIRPSKLAFSLFFVVHIVTFIFTAICPSELTFAMHLVLPPLAGVLTPIGPAVGAVSLNCVVYE